MNTLDQIVPPTGSADPGAPVPSLAVEPPNVAGSDGRGADAPAMVRVRRARRWPFALAVLGLLGPLAILEETARTSNFFALAPGDARSTQARIEITKTKTYDSKGSVLFVTVGVPRLSGLGERFARANHNDDVVPRQAILGDQTPKANREQNLKLMGYSKDFASYVALTRLGYDVPLSGGGSVVDSTCLEPGESKDCKREGPAAKLLHKQDVIIAIDGEPVHLSNDITPLLAGHKPGDSVELTVKRLGQPQPLTFTIELTTSPDDPNRAIIGFIPNESPPDDLTFTFPVDIGIDSGQVGGPSAGLAFTLAVLDKLTPGDLTGGVKVAATGTMMPNGNVGQIGGLKQKTIAVQRAGAKLFLVPDGEKEAAIMQAKGSDLKVVGVSNLDDALTAIAEAGGDTSGLQTGPK